MTDVNDKSALFPLEQLVLWEKNKSFILVLGVDKRLLICS